MGRGSGHQSSVWVGSEEGDSDRQERQRKLHRLHHVGSEQRSQHLISTKKVDVMMCLLCVLPLRHCFGQRRLEVTSIRAFLEPSQLFLPSRYSSLALSFSFASVLASSHSPSFPVILSQSSQSHDPLQQSSSQPIDRDMRSILTFAYASSECQRCHS